MLGLVTPVRKGLLKSLMLCTRYNCYESNLEPGLPSLKVGWRLKAGPVGAVEDEFPSEKSLFYS